MAVYDFAVSRDTAAERARHQLHELGLVDGQIIDLAEQRDRQLDEETLSDELREHEKELPEPIRALRRVQTLLVESLQEADDDA